MATLSLPKINAKLLTTALIAGAFATIGFDLFGQSISPMLKSIASPYLGAKLAPVPLANQAVGVITGLGGKTIGSLGIGHAVHALTGLLLYPLGYALAARPISNAIRTLRYGSSCSRKPSILRMGWDYMGRSVGPYNIRSYHCWIL